MNLGPSFSLHASLRLPVRVRTVDGAPKIIAGGVPVTPINLVLRQRQQDEGATDASLNTYVRAARLYVEFCAHRGCSLIDVSHEAFTLFKHALLGDPFYDAEGNSVHLDGKRTKRTADLMLALLYSIATDITERYGEAFDWRRYKGVPHGPMDTLPTLAVSSYASRSAFRRTHRIRWTPPKVVGLPDDQFVHLLQAAHTRWGNAITDGDRAFAEDPEAQRGALFYRNLAILLVLRYAGSRRSEVIQLRFDDINRAASLLYLATKGHRVEAGKRLPVLLFPWVRDSIWHYATRLRPVVETDLVEDQQHIFLSHSVQNYGKSLSDQSVRALLDVLRPALAPPWNQCLTPHMLRHSFGYDLQKMSGPTAVTTNMRHASSKSGEPYAAGPDVFADELLPAMNAKIGELFAQADLLGVLRP